MRGKAKIYLQMELYLLRDIVLREGDAAEIVIVCADTRQTYVRHLDK